MTKQLFLLGTGLIGGTLLTELLSKRPDLSITALIRSDDKAKQLQDLGVKPLKGELDDEQLIAEAAAKADIIIHVATADHLPSVRAIVKGIKERDSKSQKTIYLHNSGTGVIAHDPRTSAKGYPAVFSDLDPEAIDRHVPDTAIHRNIDLHIRNEIGNAQSEKEHNARVAIVLPPIVYGLGTGPFNNVSITVPALFRATVKRGTGISVGEGKNTVDAVHVQDLVDAYITILAEMERTEPGSAGGPYWFAETERYEAFSLSQRISSTLKRYGKSDGEVTKASPDDHDVLIDAFSGFFPPALVEADTETKAKATGFLFIAFASNAHSRADRLRRLGWGSRPGRLSILESVEKEEIAKLLKR